MGFYLTLDRATDIKRNDAGVPWTWKGGKQIMAFTSWLAYETYVTKNIKKLADAVAFTGSASLLQTANSFLASELKKAGLL